jgi:hypothetical protein
MKTQGVNIGMTRGKARPHIETDTEQQRKPNMSAETFSQADYEQMERLGITEAEVERQLGIFREGLQPVQLERPCTVGDGIERLESDQQTPLMARWQEAAAGGRLGEFVPASGAATRMFAFIHRIRNDLARITRADIEAGVAREDGDYKDFQKFIASLDRFAFVQPLRRLMAEASISLDERLASGEYTEMVDFLLQPEGLGFGSMPKALIPFHRYPDHLRTPVEEHLVEATHTVPDGNRCCRLHFTVAPEIEEAVVQHGRRAAMDYGEKLGVNYELSFSLQSPATNTLAVDLDDRPFRRDDGRLLFRPGGHGALLENLDRLRGDVVFVKNIDNVVTDNQRDLVLRYQRILAGKLLELQDRVFHYLKLLSMGPVTVGQQEEIIHFASEAFETISVEEFSRLAEKERLSWIFQALNRPMRVCGMVINRGEPGGGPFWVREPSGGLSLQIVEGSQVDDNSQEQVDIFQSSTHFNPVNLVCGLRDFQGRPFDLSQYVNHLAVFIARKTEEGRQLKALELPGLWNGAMAHWNTTFVEIPEVTFNPVKTVNDLLRPGHQVRDTSG